MAPPMKRASLIAILAAAAAALAGCSETETGPVGVSAIGPQPRLANPNLNMLEPPSAFLTEAAAQGLVRFDAAGEIEPALAQSWIVSDDGLRYTFRIRRTQWPDGSRVTAEQVAERLRAAISNASRNRLKTVLGGIDEIEAMTDQVIEISLAGPRPYLLQLLAQPELAVLVDGRGAGPYRAAPAAPGVISLSVPPPADEEEEDDLPRPRELLLRGEAPSRAVARFATNETDLVIGGTVGDLPIARAAELPNGRLAFDPAVGLFGLAFAEAEEGEPLADPAVRRALSMAIDRDSIVAALAVPALQPRYRIVPPIPEELPRTALPDWATAPMPMRRQSAAQTIATLDEPLRLRVAMPDGPGYRLVFAHIRRDWRLIGVEAERVAPGAQADLELIDAVAPALMASWYLRHFTCETDRVCDPAADGALEAARKARTSGEREAQLALADQILVGITPFIPIATPVRWSLVSPRLTGFRPNRFARHPAETLIAQEN